MTNKHIVDHAIVKLSASGKLPEVSEIETLTGLEAITIVRNLEKDYPKELIITKAERVVLDAYLEYQNLKSISEKTGLTYYNVSNTISRLKQKGIINEPKKSWNKTTTTYIEIIRDVFAKKNTINLKGARGYIDDNDLRAMVYLDCKQYRVKVNARDYQVIGGQYGR